MTLILTLAANFFAGTNKPALRPVLTLTKIDGEWVTVPVHAHRVDTAIRDIFADAAHTQTIPVHWDANDTAVCGDTALALALCENPF